MDTAALHIKGKVVALEANPKGINQNVSLPTWRYTRNIMVKYGNALLSKGAIAIIFIADEVAENGWADAVENFKRGSYDIEGGPASRVSTIVPVLWVHGSAKKELESGTVVTRMHMESEIPYLAIAFITAQMIMPV
jgi:hypothetical protein